METPDLGFLIDSWQPRRSSTVMQRSFAERCEMIEARLIAGAQAEIRARSSNFSSGPSIEAIFREELGKILPRRYQVTCGTLSDRMGNTARDCDVVVFNDFWFPTVKQRATVDDRSHVMPIEGAYAVLEVKQTLSRATLDKAMEKLVVCHRLHRPLTSALRFTENTTWNSHSKPPQIRNPLFSAVVAAQRDPSEPLDRLVNRFIEISRHLKRLEMVHCLCILGEACYVWGWLPDGQEDGRMASFMNEDLHRNLELVEAVPEQGESPLGQLIATIIQHATSSVLATPSDPPHRYGTGLKLRVHTSGATVRANPDWAVTEEPYEWDGE
jgi:hypothetical protein